MVLEIFVAQDGLPFGLPSCHRVTLLARGSTPHQPDASLEEAPGAAPQSGAAAPRPGALLSAQAIDYCQPPLTVCVHIMNSQPPRSTGGAADTGAVNKVPCAALTSSVAAPNTA